MIDSDSACKLRPKFSCKKLSTHQNFYAHSKNFKHLVNRLVHLKSFKCFTVQEVSLKIRATLSYQILDIFEIGMTKKQHN